MAATPTTATTPSLLASSSTIASTDILIANVSGTTKKITAGNLRTQMFAFGGADPLSLGALTAVGNSTITGTLGGVTQLTVTPNGIAVTGNSSITGTLSGVTTLTTTNLSSTTMVGDLLFTDATYDIGKSGATRPRDGFFSRTLSVGGTTNLQALNATTGVFSGSTLAVQGSGAATAAFLRFDTNATNRWAIGCNVNLTGNPWDVYNYALTASAISINVANNNVTFGSSIVLSTTASKMVPGATSFSHRNNADSADNLLISDAGAVTTRSTLTVTAGGATITAGNLAVTAGNLTFGAAAARIIPGATSLTIRDTANANDNFVIADSGAASVRGSLSLANTLNFTSAACKIIPGATSFSIRDNADSADRLLLNASGFTVLNTLITTASATGAVGFRLPHGTAPTSPTDGDFWSTTTTLNFRLNGVTKSITMT